MVRGSLGGHDRELRRKGALELRERHPHARRALALERRDRTVERHAHRARTANGSHAAPRRAGRRSLRRSRAGRVPCFERRRVRTSARRGMRQRRIRTACSGPTRSSDQLSASAPARLTRPYVGFTPTRPHCDAGIRIEPPVSDPIAPITAPAATAAPEPPLEPPGLRSRSHGFRTGGVYTPHASTCVAVLPTSTAPAVRSRATAAASRLAGRAFAYAREPLPVG